MKSILCCHNIARFVFVLFLGCSAGLRGQPAPATSGLVPHFLFSDNMVLQRDREAPVWGHAAPGVLRGGIIPGRATNRFGFRIAVEKQSPSHLPSIITNP